MYTLIRAIRRYGEIFLAGGCPHCVTLIIVIPIHTLLCRPCLPGSKASYVYNGFFPFIFGWDGDRAALGRKRKDFLAVHRLCQLDTYREKRTHKKTFCSDLFSL